MNSAPSSQGLKANEIVPYVQQFRAYCFEFGKVGALAKTDQLKITFGSVSDPVKTVAECYSYTNEIIIDKKFFNALPIESKEELIFHELGHCSLDVDHQPTGIMKPEGLHNPTFYRKNHTKLINQLFGCKTLDCVDTKFNEEKYKQGKTVSKKDEILANDHAVVRFTAEWCPPCKQLKPIFEEVALKYPNVKVYVIDIDKDPDTPVQFGVRGIPTMIKVVDKAENTRLVGNQSKEEVEKLFKK